MTYVVWIAVRHVPRINLVRCTYCSLVVHLRRFIDLKLTFDHHSGDFSFFFKYYIIRTVKGWRGEGRGYREKIFFTLFVFVCEFFEQY